MSRTAFSNGRWEIERILSQPMMIDARGVNRGVAPVTYGTGGRPPRGDYVSASSDFTCDQNWQQYTAEEHDLYRRLFQRQSAQLSGLACDEFVEALPSLGDLRQVPHFGALSEVLRKATGW